MLLARGAQIEAHARALLEGVTHEELATLRAATEQAWDAWAVGLLVPAQAGAGAIVGEILLRHGFRDFGPFRIEWERFRNARVEEWELTELRTTALMCALSTTIQREDQGTFPGFHRHLALHRLDPEQYTPANPLARPRPERRPHHHPGALELAQLTAGTGRLLHSPPSGAREQTPEATRAQTYAYACGQHPNEPPNGAWLRGHDLRKPKGGWQNLRGTEPDRPNHDNIHQISYYQEVADRLFPYVNADDTCKTRTAMRWSTSCRRSNAK